MYRVVLLMLAVVFAASAESYACFRHRMFRNRSQCCAPVCEPVVNGDMPSANDDPNSNPPAADLSPTEEQRLKTLLDAHKKAGTFNEKELKEFEDWYRGTATPEERAKEKLPDAGPAPLSKDDEKHLKEIMENYKKNNTLDAKGLKEYEKWFRESASPADRKQDYQDLKKSGTRLDAPAQILVSLPASATLTFDGNPTTSTSNLRLFSTPAVNAGGLNLYQLQATVQRNGLQASVTRLVRVRPGETTEVTLDISISQFIQTARR
jgi:uncharacterized protein (TIGR03000 family)